MEMRFLLHLTKKQEKGKSESIEVFYSGRPRLAKRPPWDGGVQWVPDGKGNTIISTSCQGLGVQRLVALQGPYVRRTRQYDGQYYCSQKV